VGVGAGAVRECLEALGGQQAAPALDVIVPWDDSIPEVGALQKDFPRVRFLAMGPIRTERTLASPGGQHELFDRRRSAGLKVTSGEIVCILEDRGIPDLDWAATVARLHAALPYAVIGGAVECGIDAPLNWAVYFCDYGRYQLPLVAGPREYVTDVNISYKRAALERVRSLWEARYHETTVHWELVRQGETLWLTPDLVVRQRRRGLSVKSILRERIEWARLFAYTRVREASTLARVAYTLLAPLLPVVLFVRHARMQAEKRVHFMRFAAVSPFVALFLAAWSLGESIGYLSGRP
ncbi:MAG: hypothetical protein ABL963_15015, partial [Longimicrobiales bacterium]